MLTRRVKMSSAASWRTKYKAPLYLACKIPLISTKLSKIPPPTTNPMYAYRASPSGVNGPPAPPPSRNSWSSQSSPKSSCWPPLSVPNTSYSSNTSTAVGEVVGGVPTTMA
uniref:(northern house mosquito) hypothetical protein n=1 Tax=Culex pipiens TaxID=7175 RepID=A0A8D8D0E1_CULPI